MKRLLVLVLVMAMLLCGCGKKPAVKLVTQISVNWEPDTIAADRSYTDSYKMQRVLNRMRQLGQRYSPDVDPEALDIPGVTITLTFNDGSSNHHQLKGDRYIRSDGEKWQQTDAEKLQRLQFMLKALPGDG